MYWISLPKHFAQIGFIPETFLNFHNLPTFSINIDVSLTYFPFVQRRWQCLHKGFGKTWSKVSVAQKFRLKTCRNLLRITAFQNPCSSSFFFLFFCWALLNDWSTRVTWLMEEQHTVHLKTCRNIWFSVCFGWVLSSIRLLRRFYGVVRNFFVWTPKYSRVWKALVQFCYKTRH